MDDAIDELDKPRLTLLDLQEFLELDEDIPVTLRQLREAVLRGELVPTEVEQPQLFQQARWAGLACGAARQVSREKPICLVNGLPQSRTWPRTGGGDYQLDGRESS